jgi:membrane protease YdiL (CAAX protease family)
MAPLTVTDMSRGRSLRVVITAYAAMGLSGLLCGLFLRPWMESTFPILPPSTVDVLMPGIIPPFVCLSYLLVRIGFVPRLIVKKEVILYSFGGTVMAWFVVCMHTLTFGHGAISDLNIAGPYYYVNLFFLMIWAPLVEETIYRGYFFDILRQKLRTPFALLLSSLLFTLAHIDLSVGFEPNLAFIFLCSIVFSLVYVEGGLIASIWTHFFLSAYSVYVCSG